MGDDFSLLTSGWDDVSKFFGLNGQTTASTAGLSPQQTKVATSAATLNNAGMLTQLFGAASSAIGGYYAAKTQQYQDKSQASSLEFQSNMDAINSRQAELSAQSIEEQGKSQVSQYTMQAAQQQSAQTVGTAARGVDLTSGSAIQQRASSELVKDMDVYTINANATRAAAGERTQATNDSNEALLARTGAANLNASAASISPGAAAATSLLSSASSVGSQWDWRRKLTTASLQGSAA